MKVTVICCEEERGGLGRLDKLLDEETRKKEADARVFCLVGIDGAALQSWYEAKRAVHGPCTLLVSSASADTSARSGVGMLLRHHPVIAQQQQQLAAPCSLHPCIAPSQASTSGSLIASKVSGVVIATACTYRPAETSSTSLSKIVAFLDALTQWARQVVRSGQCLLLALHLPHLPYSRREQELSDGKEEATAADDLQAALARLSAVGLADLSLTRQDSQSSTNTSTSTSSSFASSCLLLGSLVMHSRLTCLLDHRSSGDEQHCALHASFRDARRIFACFFGSQLHGTDTCDSDIDIMGLLLPTPRDMLLGIGASKEVTHRTKAALEKNGAEDVDTNFITPLDFVEQLASGQPIAWEMLFAPPHSHAPDTTDEGLAFLAALREQVPQLLTSSTKAVRGLMDNFERRIKRELQKREMSASDERVLLLLQQGQLYKSADAKKLAHSLRVCQQAIELHEHGRITLPRPNAEHLRAIKRKEVPLHQVLEQIDQAKSRLLEICGAGERREISDKTGAYDAIEALVRKHLGMTARST